jgi:hypothetical protein
MWIRALPQSPRTPVPKEATLMGKVLLPAGPHGVGGKSLGALWEQARRATHENSNPESEDLLTQ